MTTAEDTPAATTAHTAAAEDSARVRHPLDPLTGAEIEAATSILKRDRHLKDSARFVYVTLREPDKDTVLSYRKGQTIDREAHIVLRERAERKTYEAIVCLTTGDVKLWTELPGVQPAIMLEEFLATEEIVRKDPRWQEAMRRRGVTDFDMVMIDPWSVGYNGPEDAAQNGRFLRPLTWVRQGDPDDNGYARPVEGLIVRFDLDRMEVVDIEDHGVVPLPPASGNYTAEAIKDPANVPANAICMHEEDHGISWKHMDWRTGKTEVRRSRRLVISMIATVGNYEYGYFWYLYQDGTIEYEVKLTGVISNGALPPGQRPAHGTLVAPQVYGPHHQHIFCVRLDMMVDGPGNTVVECDSVALPPGPDNPHGNAWVVRQTPLARESEAQRLADGRTARYWRIINPNRPNGVGEPVAYKLVPQGDSVLPFHQPGSHVIRRAQFATKHLWVTAYHPDQRFPAGEYPNQHPGGDGLPAWTAADRPLENTDLVLWHTFTAHHVVRPEDWPVMPVTTVGFKLRADGFFDGNPALDLPPAEHCHHEE